ncbi:MAG: sigma-70 family RNA polymerase sigma factor [Ignavibacteriaceae bacterium]|nr:sigma-70 family RNA polymerase sigma factor [Ignavibacteriaceae bacterium]
MGNLSVTTNNTLTDTEIMLKIAGYDSTALELLYDRYSPILFALIKRIIPNQEIAEGILYDVFIIISKHLDQLDYKSCDVYTWLITLTRNKAVDVLRRRLGKEKRQYNDEYEKEEILPKLSPEIKALEFADIIRMKNNIQSAFNSLPDSQRTLIELAYYEGQDENFIAENLRIPVSSVKSKLRLANASLMKQIFYGGK